MSECLSQWSVTLSTQTSPLPVCYRLVLWPLHQQPATEGHLPEVLCSPKEQHLAVQTDWVSSGSLNGEQGSNQLGWEQGSKE